MARSGLWRPLENLCHYRFASEFLSEDPFQLSASAWPSTRGRILPEISESTTASVRTLEQRGQDGKAGVQQGDRSDSSLESVPGPARDAETVGYVIGRLVELGHRVCSDPGKIVVQNLPYRIGFRQSDVG